MALNIEDPAKKADSNSFALFALGFRPFFLTSAVLAPVLLTLWLLHLTGKISVNAYYNATGWHAHEMLFGYTVAVIAGFLLTAAGNWTGIRIISGPRLALLWLVFLAGRIAPFIPGISPLVIALVDLAFLPLVAVLLAIPIIRVRQWSNIIFIPVLLLMMTANLLVHGSLLGWFDLGLQAGNRAMLYLVVLLIMIMGGRVIPFFTERGVQGVKTRSWKFIELLVPVSLLLFATTELFQLGKSWIGITAIFAVLVNTVRLYGWYDRRIWRVPLVWILQLAYAWFIIGFALKATILFELPQIVFAYHAFTVGGIGTMTIGMMARVTLGHTGRQMLLPAPMFWAFILIVLAAIARVIMPVFIPEAYMSLLKIAGSLWIASFLIFLWVYLPMWWRARVDGRPG